jgi:hypothetical protein
MGDPVSVDEGDVRIAPEPAAGGHEDGTLPQKKKPRNIGRPD